MGGGCRRRPDLGTPNCLSAVISHHELPPPGSSSSLPLHSGVELMPQTFNTVMTMPINTEEELKNASSPSFQFMRS
jgi:hypothetical protein